jgi:hypothetical protein
MPDELSGSLQAALDWERLPPEDARTRLATLLEKARALGYL